MLDFHKIQRCTSNIISESNFLKIINLFLYNNKAVKISVIALQANAAFSAQGCIFRKFFKNFWLQLLYRSRS